MINNTTSKLNTLIDHLKKKSEYLGKILEFSNSIGDLIDAEGDEAAEKINELTEKRGAYVEEVKKTDVTLKHYSLELNEDELILYETMRRENLFDPDADKEPVKREFTYFWEKEVYLLLIEQLEILKNIKAADNINNIKISGLMDDIKLKIKNIRNNRNIMNKYIDDGNIKSGAMLHEKK